MNKGMKALIIVFIVVALASVYYIKNSQKEIVIDKTIKSQTDNSLNLGTDVKIQNKEGKANNQTINTREITLMEFGFEACPPCQMMVPILNELEKEYQGKVNINRVDVYKDQKLAIEYKIRVTPTFVFLDSSGNEVYRFEGYMPKNQIVQKFREMGVE